MESSTIGGIYKIESRIKPERIYIGSALGIGKRWRDHLNLLRRGKHHSAKLQNHFNKYGESDLIFVIIELCLPEFLIIREQFYIDVLNPYFNICKIAGNTRGRVVTKDTRMKMSKSNKGKKHPPLSEETKKKMRKPHGKMSLETKLKLSKANKGKKMSFESREKISDAQKGRKLTIRWKENIGKAHKGKPKPKGRVPWNKGKLLSEEYKQKISNGRQKYELSRTI